MVEKKPTKKTGRRTSRPKAGKASAPRGKAPAGGRPRGPAAKPKKKEAAVPSGGTAPRTSTLGGGPSRAVPVRGIHDLRPASGATRGRKRVGRGPGSGHGKTAGRGSKGQKSRSGYHHQRGFEGGQMPLHRRLPKRGFTNIFRIEYDVVNLSALDVFDAGASVTPKDLAARRLAREKRPIKILGDGKLAKALTVSAHKFSASARAGIEAAGGRCEVIAR